MNAIIDAIKTALENGRDVIGIRGMTDNPVTGEAVRVTVGEELENSYHWDDGIALDEQVDGVCAISVQTCEYDIEVDLESLESAIELVKRTYGDDQIVVVAGYPSNESIVNDPCEVVVREAVCIAIVN